MARRLAWMLAALPQVLLALLVAFPAIPGLLEIFFALSGTAPEAVLNRTNPLWILGYVLARCDSGAQLPEGNALYHFLLACTALTWMLLPRPLPQRLRRAAPWLGLALASAGASASQCQHAAAAWSKWISLTLFLLLIGMVAQGCQESALPWLSSLMLGVTWTLLFCGLVLGVLSGFNEGRLPGSFHHPNVFGAFLILTLPLLATRGKSLYLRSLGVGVAVTCLLLTGSRGPLVGLTLSWSFFYLGLAETLGLFGVWVLFFCGWRGLALALAVLGLGLVWRGRTLEFKGSRQQYMAMGLAALLSLFLFLGLAQYQSTSRLGRGIESSSFQARALFWSAAASMSTTNFPLGVGGDGFRRYFPAYQSDSRFFSKFAHSLPLTLAAEWGWLFVVFLGVAWARAGRGLGLSQEMRPWACGALAFLIHSCFDVHLQFPALMGWLALYLGILCSGPESPEPPAEPSKRWLVRPGLLRQYLALLPLMGCVLYFLLDVYASHFGAAARLAARFEHPKEARELYREAARLAPWRSDFFRLAGQVLVGTEEEVTPEVLGDVRVAVARDPHRAVSHNVLGRLLEQAGRDGRPALAQALSLDPVNYPSFYTHLAQAELRRGDAVAAGRVAARGWERFPLTLLLVVSRVRTMELQQQLADLGTLYAALLLESDGTGADLEHVLRAVLFLRPDAEEVRQLLQAL